MKNIGIILLALSSFGMVACGGGASKEDACGCDEAKDFKSICETAWDACDEAGGKDGKDCKDALKDVSCK